MDTFERYTRRLHDHPTRLIQVDLVRVFSSICGPISDGIWGDDGVAGRDGGGDGRIAVDDEVTPDSFGCY